jgi:hypothetical protein
MAHRSTRKVKRSRRSRTKRQRRQRGGVNTNNNTPLANIQTNLFQGNNDPAARNVFGEGLRELRRLTHEIRRIGQGNNNSNFSYHSRNDNNRNNVASVNLWRNNNVASVNLWRNNNGAGVFPAQQRRNNNNNNLEQANANEDPIAPVRNRNENVDENVGSVGGRRRRRTQKKRTHKRRN